VKKILFYTSLLLFLTPLPVRGMDDLEALIYQLRSASPFAQFKIIEQIGDLGTAEAIDALIGFFSDEDLRWMAVRQLAMFRTAAVPPLLEILDSDDDDVLRFAVYALGEIKSPTAVPPIIDLLRHPNPEVRQNAVFALGMIGDKTATEPLIAALKDEDSVVRGYAATALGELGDPKAKEALLEALKRENASVVNMASSLYNLGSEEVVAVLIEKLRDPDPNNRLYAIYALGRISDPAEVEPLIAVLGSEDVGWLASKALIGIGEPAVKPLLEALFSDDRNIRLYATYALGEIGNPRAGRGLVRMFKDEDSLVRDTAAEALITLGDSRMVPPISRELSNPDPQIRQKALEVLGHIGDESLTDTIASYLTDEDVSVIKSAIFALGSLHSERASRSLIGLLDYPRQDVQDALRTAFMQIGDPAVPHLLDLLDGKGTTKELQAISLLGKLKASEAVDTLLSYLGHSEPIMRRMATVALTEIGDSRCEEYFVSLLNDSDPTIRIYASVGLMNIGSRIAIKLLLASLGNPDTQWLAVKILDRIASRDVDALIEALNEERTRWYASRILVELDGAILPQLEEGLKSDDPRTRENISMVLGEVKDRRAVKPLLEALKRDDQLVLTSASSLIQIGDPNSVEPLIEMLENRNEQIRLYAAYALGGLNDTRAVLPLIDILDDPSSSIRGVAAHSLGEIGSRAATNQLIALLADPSKNVRLTAVYALGKLLDRRSIPKLRELLEKDQSPQVRKASRQMLDRFVIY
jgi:HEAT repeat protein